MVYYVADGGLFKFQAPSNQWRSFQAAAEVDLTYDAKVVLR